MRLRRGFSIGAGERVLLTEDVVTTGGSLREARQIALAAGAKVEGVCALADRTGGKQPDLDLAAALRLTPPTYEAKDCPLCRKGLPLSTPGSRHLAGRP